MHVHPLPSQYLTQRPGAVTAVRQIVSLGVVPQKLTAPFLYCKGT